MCGWGQPPRRYPFTGGSPRRLHVVPTLHRVRGCVRAATIEDPFRTSPPNKVGAKVADVPRADRLTQNKSAKVADALRAGRDR